MLNERVSLTMQDFCCLQRMTQVYLSYYLCSFDASITTITTCFLIISPHRAPAEGKAVLSLLCCYYSSIVSGNAVKCLAEGHTGGKQCGSRSRSAEQTSSAFFFIKALVFSIYFL